MFFQDTGVFLVYQKPILVAANERRADSERNILAIS